MTYSNNSEITANHANMIESHSYTRKAKVAFAYPKLYLGGAEARVMWGITALKDEYDVSLITCSDVNLEKLNQFYGTSLKPTDFTVLRPRMLFLLWKYPRAVALRASLYQKFCRSVAHKFDVLISAHNLCDFGAPAIHFIIDFSWNGQIRQSGLTLTWPGQSAFHRWILCSIKAVHGWRERSVKHRDETCLAAKT